MEQPRRSTPQDNSPQPPRRRRRRRRRSNQIVSLLLVILGVLVAVAAVLFIFVQIKLNEIGRLKPGDYADITEISDIDNLTDSELQKFENAPEWSEAGIATSVEGVVNVLVVGQDTRKQGERQRSDSMIVLSVNKNSNQLTMISLMRDMYVQIPDYGGRKLNAAYQFGGFDLLDQTLADNFGLMIDYNVEVDFSGFKDIVDSLGGVDVELTEDEATYLRGEGSNYVDGKVGRWTAGRTYDVQPGVNHLDGKAALDYARARHVSGNADFGRTQRQRNLIKIIFNDLKKSSMLRLYKVYSSVAKNITTDMSNMQILSIAFSVYTMGVNEINSYRIPANNMYTDEIYGPGMDVLVPKDWNETRQFLRDILYSDDGGKAAMQAIEEKYGSQMLE